MARNDIYIDRHGHEISLRWLDKEEKEFVSELRNRARKERGHLAFRNHWTRRARDFYLARGVPPRQIGRRIGWRIGLDLNSRMMLALGLARPRDFLDDIAAIMWNDFDDRRAFCKATGLTQEQLNRLFAGDASMPLEDLSAALERIGYRLKIAPAHRKKRTG